MKEGRERLVALGEWLGTKTRSEEGDSEPGTVPPQEQGCGHGGVAEPSPGAGDGGFIPPPVFTETPGTQRGRPQHECTECGFGAEQKPELVRHPLARAAACPYVCGACGRGFGQRGGPAARLAGAPPGASGCAGTEVGAPRKERKELSLTEKVRVLEMLDGPKVSQSELAKRFGVSQPQICRIIKNKERILSEWHHNSNPERKRKREGKDVAVEAALLRWVESARAAELPVSAPLLQVKAKNLAEALGKPGFEPSGNWLARFRLRHNIALEKPPRERGDAEQPGAERWSSAVLPELLRSYAPSEVYSCGETGVLLQPPLAEEDEPAGPGGRLTLLLCANADGTEKAALRVVGQSPRPRCLRGVNLQHMPWSYRASGQALLTAPLFAEWLQDFNEEMRRKGKSVLLLLDRRQAHPYLELSNVRMVFVPPAAALAQPLDRGIARDLKGHYRRRLLMRLPAARGSEQPSLLDALHMLVQAWGDVRPGLIASCFRAAGFSPDASPDTLLAPVRFGQEQIERFVLMDEGLERLGEPADAETAEVADWDGGTVEGEDAGETVVAQPCPSQPEVWDSLATLRRYLECRATSPDLFQAFYALEDAVHALSTSSGRALHGDACAKP
ncbi:tigger transposable element-derived protein 3 [Anas platyrhynchos]|uniref:tigger transposable element-derived protein 3 n=1 Tax=Anas platyrhynchos TaxID=8839 RepID=UPI003AF2444F